MDSALLEILGELKGYLQGAVPAPVAGWAGDIIDRAIEAYEAEMVDYDQGLLELEGDHEAELATTYEKGKKDGENAAMETLIENGKNEEEAGDMPANSEGSGDAKEGDEPDFVIEVNVCHRVCCCNNEDAGEQEETDGGDAKEAEGELGDADRIE
jgi:hypothetical protein